MNRRLDRDTYIGKGRHLRAERKRADSFPLHAHDYYEMEIVLSGRGYHQIGERTEPLQGRCAIVIIRLKIALFAPYCIKRPWYATA